jgi:putative membrane protein
MRASAFTIAIAVTGGVLLLSNGGQAQNANPVPGTTPSQPQNQPAQTPAPSNGQPPAQVPPQGQSTAPGENQPPTPEALATETQPFVKAAGVSDMFEIESSKLALHLSQNAHVKMFARRMIKDHTASTAKLKATIKRAKITAAPPVGLDEPHEQMLKQLQDLKGADFDRAYAQMQIQGHEDAVKLLTNYSQSGDNRALKKFAASILPTVKDHLGHAKKLPSAIGAS